MKSKRYAQQSLGYLLNKDAPWWSGQDQLWVSLHSRDPGAMGTQTSSELKYGGYHRVEVKREGWAVNADGYAANPAPIVFPARQDAGAQIDIRCAVLGTNPTGDGQVLMRCLVAVDGGKISILQHHVPEFPAGTLEFKEE